MHGKARLLVSTASAHQRLLHPALTTAAMLERLPPEFLKDVLQSCFPPEPLTLKEAARRWYTLQQTCRAVAAALPELRVRCGAAAAAAAAGLLQGCGDAALRCGRRCAQPAGMARDLNRLHLGWPLRLRASIMAGCCPQVAVRATLPLPPAGLPWLHAHAAVLRLLPGSADSESDPDRSDEERETEEDCWMSLGDGSVPPALAELPDFSACLALKVRQQYRAGMSACRGTCLQIAVQLPRVGCASACLP